MSSEVVYSPNIQKLLGSAYLVTESSSTQLYYGRPRAPPGHVLSFDPLSRNELFRGPMRSPSMPGLVRSTIITDRYTGVKVSTHSEDQGHPSHIDMNSWVLHEDGSNFDQRRFGSSGEELSESEKALESARKYLRERGLIK